MLSGPKVSVYYLGTLCGCLFGGSLGDRHGRIRTIGLGAAWAVIGALLQTSAQNQYWMFFGTVSLSLDLCSLRTSTRIYFKSAHRLSLTTLSSPPDQRVWYRHAQRRCSRVGH